jgi:hypothetical protein
MDKLSIDRILEVVKIITGFATPIIVVVFGYKFNRTMQQLTGTQWANQKIIEKRIAVFDELAPHLNDIYCYIMFIGNWKEMTPVDIIQKKRLLDKKMYVNAALFSHNLITVYNNFMGVCFETYVGAGHDAKILTTIQSGDGNQRDAFSLEWKESWNDCFSDVSLQKEVIKDTYQKLMNEFSHELWFGFGVFGQCGLTSTKSKGAQHEFSESRSSIK